MLPKALKSRPKSNKSPNLVTLLPAYSTGVIRFVWSRISFEQMDQFGRNFWTHFTFSFQSQHAENNEKRRRTNIMILCIALVFFISWLPLNLFNIFMELYPGTYTIKPFYGSNRAWSSLVEKQLDLPNSHETMELCHAHVA